MSINFQLYPSSVHPRDTRIDLIRTFEIPLSNRLKDFFSTIPASGLRHSTTSLSPSPPSPLSLSTGDLIGQLWRFEVIATTREVLVSIDTSGYCFDEQLSPFEPVSYHLEILGMHNANGRLYSVNA